MPQKAYEPDDPMALQGVSFSEGDLEEMAECLVEEYVRLGFSDQQLWGLFRSPFFAATHALYRARGEAWVQEVINRVRDTWGQPGFRIGRGSDGNTT